MEIVYWKREELSTNMIPFYPEGLILDGVAEKVGDIIFNKAFFPDHDEKWIAEYRGHVMGLVEAAAHLQKKNTNTSTLRMAHLIGRLSRSHLRSRPRNSRWRRSTRGFLHQSQQGEDSPFCQERG